MPGSNDGSSAENSPKRRKNNPPGSKFTNRSELLEGDVELPEPHEFEVHSGDEMDIDLPAIEADNHLDTMVPPAEIIVPLWRNLKRVQAPPYDFVRRPQEKLFEFIRWLVGEVPKYYEELCKTINQEYKAAKLRQLIVWLAQVSTDTIRTAQRYSFSLAPIGCKSLPEFGCLCFFTT